MQNPYSQKAHILTVRFLRHTSLQLECTYPYSALLDAHVLTVRSVPSEHLGLYTSLTCLFVCVCVCLCVCLYVCLRVCVPIKIDPIAAVGCANLMCGMTHPCVRHD